MSRTRIGLAVVSLLAVGAFSNRTVLAQSAACGCMDVWLVIDDTGSMGGAMNSVKAGLGNIISSAQTASGGDLKMGLITFKDGLELDQDLTTNIASVTTAVNALTPSGGGGKAEDSAQAIRWAISGSLAAPAGTCTATGGPPSAMRSACLRIVVMVTDAPPAGCDFVYQDGVDDVNAAAVANEAATAGVKLSSILVDSFDFTSGAHPGGVEKDMGALYASTTGGVFTIVPSDGSGTGDAIMAIINDCGGGGGGPIPAVSEWGLIVMTLLLLAGAKVYFGRRSAVPRT